MGRAVRACLTEFPEVALRACVGRSPDDLGCPKGCAWMTPEELFAGGRDALPADCVVIDVSLAAGTARLLDWLDRTPRALVSATTGLGDAEEKRIAALAARVPVVRARNLSVGNSVAAAMLRSIPGAARALFEVDLVEHAHKNGYSFGRGKDGKPPRQEAISVAFGRLMRAIGLEGVTHHVLRHTGASAMVAAGISLRVVQDIGGWSSLRMLERYAHPSGAEMRRAVRVLTAYTTGTKTGTAPRNETSDQKKADAASSSESEVSVWRPQRDSNPCFGLERATSWASGRWGLSGRTLNHTIRYG